MSSNDSWYKALSETDKKNVVYDFLCTKPNQALVLNKFGDVTADDRGQLLLTTPKKKTFLLGPGPTYTDMILKKRGQIVTLVELLANKDTTGALDHILSYCPKPNNAIKIHAETNGPKKQSYHCWTAETLMSTDFPDVEWIVSGIVPQGETLLSGPPKGGKSFLALDIATTLSTGGKVLGNIECEQAECLYLALEDSPRRLKNRMIKQVSHPSNCLRIATEWPQGSEAILALHKYMDDFPETKLIIIDTLARFATIHDGNDYAEMSRLMAGIKAVADEYAIGIIVVHHTRKNESSDDFINSALGSIGITGIVDTILILGRKRGTSDGKLSITGRDVEEHEYAVTFDKDCCRWSITGDAKDVAETGAQQEILDLLKRSPEPMTPKMIADTLGKNPSTVRGLIQKLVMSDRIHRHLDGKSYSSINRLMGTDGKLHDSTDATDGTDGTDTADGTDGKPKNRH